MVIWASCILGTLSEGTCIAISAMSAKIPPSPVRATVLAPNLFAAAKPFTTFRELPLERLAAAAHPGALVFDGRMYFPRDAIERMRELGLRFKGVGR